MSTIDRTSIVAQIVTEHPACAKIFVAHEIDFCCHGDVTVDAACRERRLDVEQVLARLREAAGAQPPAGLADASALSTSELVAYLVSRHHAYLRRTLPALEPLVAKVAGVHGAHEPKLDDLLDEVRELRAELEPHLDEEEAELFPMLTSRAPDPAHVARGIAEARDEHARVGRSLARIRALADDFTAPDWACGSYRMMLKELAALVDDTLRHVHLENHVLMPRFSARDAGA